MATFYFSSLPWSFQKRFTEICNTRTMLNFKQLSHQTQELSKNRTICKWIRIDNRKRPDFRVKDVKISDIQNVEITKEMKIDLGQTKFTKEFVQSFSFITPYLNVTSFNIEFDALKILLDRQLTSVSFLGKIVFKNFEQEMEYLINRLANVDIVVLTLNVKRDTSEQLNELMGKYEKKNRANFDFWKFDNAYFALLKHSF